MYVPRSYPSDPKKENGVSAPVDRVPSFILSLLSSTMVTRSPATASLELSRWANLSKESFYFILKCVFLDPTKISS